MTKNKYTDGIDPYDITCCPQCGWQSPTFEGYYYQVNGKQYPIFKNNRKYYNGNFDMHDWDEVHCCKECKIEFEFSNGAV